MGKFITWKDNKFKMTGPLPPVLTPEQFQHLAADVMDLRGNIHERCIPPFVVMVKTKYDDYDAGDQDTVDYTDAYVAENKMMAVGIKAAIEAAAELWFNRSYMVDVTIPVYPDEHVTVRHLGGPVKPSDALCGCLAVWLEHFDSYFKDKYASLNALNRRHLETIAEMIEGDPSIRTELLELAAEKSPDPA